MDGEVSINGPYGKAGNLTTKPLIFEGESLYLNCDASGGGAITVSIRSASSARLLLGPSEPIVHNSVRAKVKWESAGSGYAKASVQDGGGRRAGYL